MAKWIRLLCLFGLGRGIEKNGLCSSCVTLAGVKQRRIPFPFRPRNDPPHLLHIFSFSSHLAKPGDGNGTVFFRPRSEKEPHPVELAQFKCSGWRDHARAKRPAKTNRARHIPEAKPTFSKLFTLFSCLNGARSRLREVTQQRSYLLGYGRLSARRCPLAKENLGLSDDSRCAHYASFEPLRYLGAEPFRYLFCLQRYIQISSSCASYVEG